MSWAMLTHLVMSNSLDSMDCNLPGTSVHGDSGENTGVGYHALLQGIFLTQGLNQGLPHCRQFFTCLSHQWSLVIRTIRIGVLPISIKCSQVAFIYLRNNTSSFNRLDTRHFASCLDRWSRLSGKLNKHQQLNRKKKFSNFLKQVFIINII